MEAGGPLLRNLEKGRFLSFQIIIYLSEKRDEQY